MAGNAWLGSLTVLAWRHRGCGVPSRHADINRFCDIAALNKSSLFATAPIGWKVTVVALPGGYSVHPLHSP